MEYINTLEETLKTSLPAPWLDSYNFAIAEGNPHSKKFPLMNPFHVLLVAIAYLAIIFIGQAIMKNRKRFELYWFSLFHNGAMVCLSAYMFYEIFRQAILCEFTLFGNGIDTTAKGLPLAKVLWLFYFSKPIEFIDTFIMVLKKNNRQVSFLHVYHHVATFLIWWGVVYYAPGGDSYFSSGQNGIVHVLMYGYYFLATLKVPCPWKFYITQLQMIQFALNAIQAIYVLNYHTAYPALWAKVLLIYMITLLILFGNFYIQNKSKSSDPTSPSASPKQKKVE